MGGVSVVPLVGAISAEGSLPLPQTGGSLPPEEPPPLLPPPPEELPPPLPLPPDGEVAFVALVVLVGKVPEVRLAGRREGVCTGFVLFFGIMVIFVKGICKEDEVFSPKTSACGSSCACGIEK